MASRSAMPQVRDRLAGNGGLRRPPDPTPYRLALGVGGIAAASALATAIVSPIAPPAAVPSAGVVAAGNPAVNGTTVSAGVGVAGQNQPGAANAATITQQRAVQYIQLQPGQTAPPGAKVIDAKAPKPITVVTKVPAPAAAQQTVVVRTTQSGRVLP